MSSESDQSSVSGGLKQERAVGRLLSDHWTLKKSCRYISTEYACLAESKYFCTVMIGVNVNIKVLDALKDLKWKKAMRSMTEEYDSLIKMKT